jgi:hypothetical protein
MRGPLAMNTVRERRVTMETMAANGLTNVSFPPLLRTMSVADQADVKCNRTSRRAGTGSHTKKMPLTFLGQRHLMVEAAGRLIQLFRVGRTMPSPSPMIRAGCGACYPSFAADGS